MNTILVAVWALLFQAPVQPTGAIEGVVVRADTNAPIAGARVNIVASGIQRAPLLPVVTDAAGRFVLADLPPGDYRLVPSHKDFLPAGRSANVTVISARSVAGVIVAMSPLSSASGRVFDLNRMPVADVSVQALKYAYEDGRRILIPVRTAVTNRDGEYALPSLTPGSYFVRVAPDEGSSSKPARLAVYFPNTTDASTASPIDVPAGLDLNGVDLTLIDARALQLRGVAVNGLTGAAAAGASLSLVPRRGTVSIGSLKRGAVTGDGRFEIRDIAPGSYDVVATVPFQGELLAGSAPLEMARDNVDNITVVLQPQLTIRGRIDIENGQGGPAPIDLQRLRVQLRREPFIPELLILTPQISPDGTFSLSGVTPGEYQLKVRFDGPAYAKTARFGSVDALSPSFAIHGPGDLEIALSTTPGSFEATAVDRAQKPRPEATVVLVPDPPRRRRSDLYYVSGSNTSGRAMFRNVAPGDYRLYAWDDIPGDAWLDADFLRTYEHLGVSVHINESSHQSAEVRVIEK